MNSITINKKEYPDDDLFILQFHETYFNLKIYPILNSLETISGLMSDLAEMYFFENFKVNYSIIGNVNSTLLFLSNNLLNFDNLFSSILLTFCLMFIDFLEKSFAKKT